MDGDVMQTDASIQAKDFLSYGQQKHDEFRDEADRNLNYFIGKQWDDAVVAKRKERFAPSLTINIISPFVKLVTGLMRQSTMDYTLNPVESSDNAVAEAMSAAMKHVCKMNNLENLDALTFMAGMTMRRGFYSLDLEEDEDTGALRIVVCEEDPRYIMLDPAMKKYDMSDAEFCARYRYLTENKIKKIYGEKAADISFSALSSDSFDPMADWETALYGAKELKRFRIAEVYWRDYEFINEIIDTTTRIAYRFDKENDTVSTPAGMMPTNDLVQQLRQINPAVQLKDRSRTLTKIRCTTVFGNNELNDYDMPLNKHWYCRDKFPIIPFFPLYLFGKDKCIVDDLISIQDEKNQRRSQLVHLINLYANAPWVGDPAALEDPTVLEKWGSAPNVFIRMNPNYQWGKSIARAEPAQVPAYVDRLDDKDSQTAREVTGVNPDLLGFPEQQSSGRALALRQQQGMTGLAPELGNFMDTKTLLGKYLLGAIQVVMQPDELIRILGQKDYAGLQDPAFIQKFKDQATAKYDVTLTEVKGAPTKRQGDFEMLKEIGQMFPGVIPPEIFIEASDVPYKDKIMQYMQQQAQAVAQGQAAQAMKQLTQQGAQVPPEQMGVTQQDMTQGPAMA